MKTVFKLFGSIGLILGISFISLKFINEVSRKRRMERLFEEYED